MTEQPADIPLLVSIGVSGHRELGDARNVERVRALVQEQFATLHRRLAAYGKPIEYLLLSPLAEGADRVFVEAVWAVEPRARLLVPLPFAKAAYERSFATEASVAEFNDYLQHPNCIEWLELPGGEPGEYFDVGKYVVDSCDVVFFLHDGAEVDDGALDGGTSSVIRYAEHKAGCTIAAPGDRARTGMRPAAAGPHADLMAVYVDVSALRARAVSARAGSASLEGLDLDGFFGRICHHRTGELRMALRGVRSREAFRDSVEAFSTGHFDLRASRCQRRFGAQSTLVIWLAFLISVLVLMDWGSGGNQVFDPLGPLKKIVNWDSMVAAGLVTIVWLVHFFNRKDHLTEWVENRYLAERLRHVSLFLDAGIPLSAILAQAREDPAGRPLKKLWQSIYFHCLMRFRELGLAPLSPDRLKRDLLSPDGLPRRQLAWHLRRAMEKRRSHSRQKRLRSLLFVLSLSTSLVAASAVALEFETERLSTLFDVVSSFFSLLLASYAAFTQLKENNRIASRYEVTCEQLAGLETDVYFTVLSDPALEMRRLQGLVMGNSEILMKTTYDWLNAMQEKSPEWA